MRAKPAHDETLAAAFGDAAGEHFEWQVSHPAVAERERRLVRDAFLPLGRRVLDLGCAEGGTLVHLDRPAGAVGLDLFLPKLAFARAHVGCGSFVAGSGLELPFVAAAFDHVLVRDVVHHVPDREALVEECRRVLAPGGVVDVLEPCRENPLILAHALAVRAERGELRSSEGILRRLVERRFEIVRVDRYQAFPLHRLVFHPGVGSPRLASSPAVRRAVDLAEALAERILPRAMHAYVRIRGVAR